MNHPADRIWPLRHRLQALESSLTARLVRLEAAASAPPLPPASGPLARLRAAVAASAKWMGPVLPQMISSIVLLVLGLWVKDSVDLAIKQQQLQLSYLAQMKGELVAVADPARDVEERKRAAVLVAAFGKPAIMPLVHELRAGGDGVVAIEAGLASLAITDPASVCETMREVLGSPVPWLDAPGLMAAVRTLGLANCSSALPVLRSQLALAQSARQGAQVDPALARRLVAGVPTPTQLKSLAAELEQNIDFIEAHARPFWGRR